MASGLLLTTKFYAPGSPRLLVPRPRLLTGFSHGVGPKLVLISAPAGFGKTTLLAEWLAAAQAAKASEAALFAWLSLDREDNHPETFWQYVIAALQTVAPDVGNSALTMLHEPEPPAVQTVLTALLNDLSALTTDLVLVLDDYHVIDARDVHEGVTFLLEHLPPHMHLVIASRTDPPFPLARMRASGEFLEVRAANLRFNSDETSTYFNDVMHVSLTAQDVEALDSRTEGWIAALQLAALSMQGREDNTDFIAEFAGDDRYIVDYLVEEVLQRQPEDVHVFLLQTSILGRLHGPLCDAVTGQGSGRAMLETLDRENLFLIPLDDRRGWYRYHHLFADVLRARLLHERPDEVNALHLRASEWYHQKGEPNEAIHHAMAGQDAQRAAAFVELALPETARDRQEAKLRRWFDALPDELVRVSPVLSNAYAGSRLVRGEVEGVEARLQDAERWLDATAAATTAHAARPPEMVVVDEEAFRVLPAGVAVHRAGQARLFGDIQGTMAHAQRALDLVVADDHMNRAAASALLGLAHWTNGDLDAVHRLYSDAVAHMEKAGYLSDIVGCAITLADIRMAQGRLRDAMSTYEWGLTVATDDTVSIRRGAADMHVGIANVLRERNELEAAKQHLLTSNELGEHVGLPQNRYRWRVAMAEIHSTEEDLSGAAVLLDEAERVYTGDYSPDFRPVAAVKARVLIAQGKWSDVLDWARAHDLSVDDELGYLHEFEHITLARALVAQCREQGGAASPGLSPKVMEFLERLLRSAEGGGRMGSVIELLVLQSLTHQLHDDVHAAMVPLDRALTLAEPEGYVRIFVDEGQPMAALLHAAADRSPTPKYAQRLLSALDTSAPRASTVAAGQNLLEPLSEREIDVLRLLATELSGPDIARELVVSLNTVRTHTKNIYSKLGVNSRRAAVRQADELHLLRRTRESNS